MRVFSGIQPTGQPHLGNYFGAFENWVKLQNEGHDCIYSIVNQHAITLPRDKGKLVKDIVEMGAILLAVGIDPNKSILFVQSDVPAHAQLTWILNCLAPIGQMERMIQFKEKSEKDPSVVNMGLFSYPVLMAADILLYKTELVPVGIDQAQHLELTRDLVQKFNNKYGNFFIEPKTLHTETKKVVGLDGKSKMSKSYDNYIGLTESSESIWKKLSVAVTNLARIKKSDPGNPDVCNIYSLHKLFSCQEEVDWIREGCTGAKIGCLECKKKLFENIEKFILPIREKYFEFMKKPDEVKEILHEGAKKASQIANKTLEEVYDLIGFKY